MYFPDRGSGAYTLYCISTPLLLVTVYAKLIQLVVNPMCYTVFKGGCDCDTARRAICSLSCTWLAALCISLVCGQT